MLTVAGILCGGLTNLLCMMGITGVYWDERKREEKTREEEEAEDKEETVLYEG